VKFTGCVVVTVTGKLNPLIENSVGFVPPIVTDETCTLAPLAVKVPVCVPLIPSTTLPTATGVLTAKVLCVCCSTPVPLTEIFNVEFSAFDVIATPPVKFPADCGANVTLNVALCPIPSVTGGVIPETLNPVPLAAIWLIVTLACPEFVTLPPRLALLPACTLPKAMLGDAGVSWPCCCCCCWVCFELNPWQPTKPATPAATSIPAQRFFPRFISFEWP
jgi:hypothetical protein